MNNFVLFQIQKHTYSLELDQIEFSIKKKNFLIIDLEGDKRRGIKRRTATIEVRFSEITITANQYTNKKLPKEITLYAIEAKEVGENIENPIHWRLLTTKKVEDFATALLCIEW